MKALICKFPRVIVPRNTGESPLSYFRIEGNEQDIKIPRDLVAEVKAAINENPPKWQIINYISKEVERGSQNPRHLRFFYDVCAELIERGLIDLTTFPEVPQIFTALRSKGVRIYTFSRASYRLQVAMLENLPMIRRGSTPSLADLVSGCIESEKLGSPRQALTYLQISHAIETHPTDILLLTGNILELDPALEAKYEVAYVHRDHGRIEAEKNYKVIRSLYEIDSKGVMPTDPPRHF